MSDDINPSSVELATELTIAWLNNPNNRVSAEEVPTFLRTMHATLAELAGGAATPAAEDGETQEEYTPAVSARRSLASRDHIISMIDGKPYKTLTRHLSGHGLTPAQYRQRYKLKADYPMIAESYSEHRRELAKRIGLGRRSAGAAPAGEADAKPKAAPKKAPAKPKTAPTAE